MNFDIFHKKVRKSSKRLIDDNYARKFYIKVSKLKINGFVYNDTSLIMEYDEDYISIYNNGYVGDIEYYDIISMSFQLNEYVHFGLK